MENRNSIIAMLASVQPQRVPVQMRVLEPVRATDTEMIIWESDARGILVSSAEMRALVLEQIGWDDDIAAEAGCVHRDWPSELLEIAVEAVWPEGLYVAPHAGLPDALEPLGRALHHLQPWDTMAVKRIRRIIAALPPMSIPMRFEVRSGNRLVADDVTCNMSLSAGEVRQLIREAHPRAVVWRGLEDLCEPLEMDAETRRALIEAADGRRYEIDAEPLIRRAREILNYESPGLTLIPEQEEGFPKQEEGFPEHEDGRPGLEAGIA